MCNIDPSSSWAQTPNLSTTSQKNALHPHPMLGLSPRDRNLLGPKVTWGATPSDDFHSPSLEQMAVLGQLWKGP